LRDVPGIEISADKADIQSYIYKRIGAIPRARWIMQSTQKDQIISELVDAARGM
jgi:hypothetical protein